MLTLEERERRAYIAGDATVAAALGEAIDVESEKIQDLDYEVRQLTEEVKHLEDMLAERDDA